MHAHTWTEILYFPFGGTYRLVASSVYPLQPNVSESGLFCVSLDGHGRVEERRDADAELLTGHADGLEHILERVGL